MATLVYGQSDDNIYFEGDVCGQVSEYGTHEREHGVLVICSDGTLLEVKYGKADLAIWEVKLLKAGELFERIDPCMDEDAEIYSDIARFRDGLKWAYAASQWKRVR